MSESSVVESSAPPEVQAEAEALGWIPPVRFKGDPERFIDAEDYIRRGEEVLPIVRQQNKKLKAELEEVRAQATSNAAALKAAQEAIEQIEERHSVATQKAVERAREQLKAQLASASEAGDHEALAELTDRLTQLNAAEKEAPPVEKPAAPIVPPQFVPPPEMVEWNEENPWFGTDKRRTALALAIAQELREGGETSTGRRFFDKVKSQLEEAYPVAGATGGKVESARNGSHDAPSRGSRAKSFASLPADAKEACDADAKQFVGPTKKYKSIDEWRSRYTELYYEGS